MSDLNIDRQAIRTRAYQLWVERGCPAGSADRDWHEAEQELRRACQEQLGQALSSSAREASTTAKEALQSSSPTASMPAQRASTSKDAARNKKAKDGKSKLKDPSHQPGAASASRLLAKLAANARS